VTRALPCNSVLFSVVQRKQMYRACPCPTSTQHAINIITLTMSCLHRVTSMCAIPPCITSLLSTSGIDPAVPSRRCARFTGAAPAGLPANTSSRGSACSSTGECGFSSAPICSDRSPASPEGGWCQSVPPSERGPDREDCATLDGASDGYRDALPLEPDPQPAVDEMEPDVVLSFPKLAEVSKGKVPG